ncbi:MAG: UDP-N-acetylglucosamine--N-acetylmuramyl-(pentapeptide) pyrophosphoryl-undecaprenol N-acetylglucosamine transferase [Bacteroidetes bacterium]|nr:UDP-N-acetylglucosamine--N-acetylmuramyl-(pentapeptide) pyrophosphoryl-undecaprenol N-acetylglucosamine transferase [Bacteroidota bacterium]MDA0903350.1 UDP-N-acetylglucosamine--N-acetylmuramyl-(pentapeptide) pyrophosphoryl-undecaprenol N-acetylglucosamine transferase [Bacteroidota bacterium]MDA1242316.1 UDP-N-acetylglucosamine--N-acetylmuramyl-(pentapeptide) pyrophosphoryl-undecaprenol N-acetylglucosamine transferase [Bacteroidota bacterium]
MSQQIKQVLISGGGTGGHIHPALAIADEIKERHPHAGIHFVGALGRMEMDKVPASGYPITGLWISGLDRSLTSLRNLTFPLKLMSSLWRARQLLRKHRPDVVIGVGGFASGPLLDQAVRMGIPTLIQEQNSFPGITNRLLAKRVDCICAGMPGMERWFPANRIVETGNPLRGHVRDLAGGGESHADRHGSETHIQEPSRGAASQGTASRGAASQGTASQGAASHWGLSENIPLVFVMGGSLGAQSMNDAVKALISAQPQSSERGFQLLWQCGSRHEKECQEWLSGQACDGVVCTGFIDRMDLAYRAAHVIASRAGAMSVAELALVGKPTILVPSPHVAEDHQTFNARSLTDRGAAVLLPDVDVKSKLGTTLASLLTDPQRCRAMGQAMKEAARPWAAKAVVDEVQRLVFNASRQ